MRDLRVCIVSSPISKAFIGPLSNLNTILNNLSNETYMIVGTTEKKIAIPNEKSRIYVSYKRVSNKFIVNVFRYAMLQLVIFLKILQILKNIDLLIFFMQGGLIPHILLAKIFGKKVIWILPSSMVEISKYDKGSSNSLMSYLQRFEYLLSDNIIVYAPKLINEWHLSRYKRKILISSEHFINFDKFKPFTQLDERSNTVGYIGRFSHEKGILSFINAIPGVIEEDNNIDFLICGDGVLLKEVSSLIIDLGLTNKVQLTEWIPHDLLPIYLNRLKLIVLPSGTEGLPNIMLEAMACGTPVLATSVGAIPDIIKDCETGFLMDNNSPECIASNIIRSIRYPNLDEVAYRSMRLAQINFSFDAALARWKNVLN